MASKRMREKRSVGNRIIRLESEAEKNPTNVGNPVSNLAENSVGGTQLAPESVRDEHIAAAAVNTVHLGTVNEIKSDSAMNLSAPEGLYVNGVLHPTGDTGWVDLSSYFLSGTASGRIVGNVVYISGTTETDAALGTSVTELLATPLPTGWRPVRNFWGSAYSAGMSMSVIIRAAGTMGVSNRNAVAATSQIQFTISYLLG